jgi:hypothetical protein
MPYTEKRATVSLKAEMADKLKVLAAQENRSLNGQVNQLIEESLARREGTIPLEEVIDQFKKWGVKGVSELIAKGFQFLQTQTASAEAEEEQQARDLLLKLINGDSPTQPELCRLANALGTSKSKLNELIRKVQNGESKKTNGQPKA